MHKTTPRHGTFIIIETTPKFKKKLKKDAIKVNSTMKDFILAHLQRSRKDLHPFKSIKVFQDA